MNGSFPALIVIWIIVYFLKNKDEVEYIPVIVDRLKEEEDPEKVILYWSNGKILDLPHVLYYYEMLSINPFRQITDKDVEDAFTERYSLINKIDYDNNWPIATRDVNAAKLYLIDRINYLNNLN
jgi:hypothetical protein